MTVMVHFSVKQSDDVITKNHVINMSQSRISVSNKTGAWSRFWEMHMLANIAVVLAKCAYGLTLTWMYAQADMLSDTFEITMKEPTCIEIVLILKDIYDNT